MIPVDGGTLRCTIPREVKIWIIVRLLLEEGADPTKPDDYGSNPRENLLGDTNGRTESLPRTERVGGYLCNFESLESRAQLFLVQGSKRGWCRC